MLLDFQVGTRALEPKPNAFGSSFSAMLLAICLMNRVRCTLLLCIYLFLVVRLVPVKGQSRRENSLHASQNTNAESHQSVGRKSRNLQNQLSERTKANRK